MYINIICVKTGIWRCVQILDAFLSSIDYEAPPRPPEVSLHEILIIPDAAERCGQSFFLILPILDQCPCSIAREIHAVAIIAIVLL